MTKLILISLFTATTLTTASAEGMFSISEMMKEMRDVVKDIKTEMTDVTTDIKESTTNAVNDAKNSAVDAKDIAAKLQDQGQDAATDMKKEADVTKDAIITESEDLTKK